MRKDLIPTMEEFNAMSKSDQIASLCIVHECNPKIKAVHRDQYVNKAWNPHPPELFVRWWATGGVEQTEKKTGRGWSSADGPLNAVTAFNCEAVRECYREAKQFGLAQI